MSSEKIFKTWNEWQAYCVLNCPERYKCISGLKKCECQFAAGQSYPNDKIKRALEELYSEKYTEEHKRIVTVIKILEEK